MDTVDLLWRHHMPRPQRRGRPPKLATDDVVAAAITVADRNGLSFTLRDVAEALSTPVMSLYSYVESREQLLALMVDQCRLDMTHSELSGDWAEQLTAVASDNLQLLDTHPWLAEVESERTVLGPGTLTKYERELGAVQTLPLTDAERDAALTLVLDFVRASARALTHARRERAQETPEQWWDREGAKLAGLGVDERFPLASRIGTAAGQAQNAANNADAAYAFGLSVILAGLAAR
ncbi:TetR/AcrR family transcriptional regulator [Mycolicibacterium hippocampi]|uniref:TetR family transcriptional regulator n=1 Tax=Mycolicibacterium hippocampi TaxID=659824 RepID=A0A7I9ZKF3_9MYCO|nr:TetR/AcrR family transcriptional regulator C-terminal domain-containing protein [Mycolicibacterium hippocampi]GFH01502.1 TetR family transcriptional regulator [Mycolicibacterium hippocampi]